MSKYLVMPTAEVDHDNLAALRVFDSAEEAGAYLRAEGYRSFKDASDQDLFEIAATPVQAVKPYWLAKTFADQAELDAWLSEA